MAKYRKVDPRIWNDGKFMDLSDSGKLALFFVLTHPNMTAVGAMRHTIPGMAAELGWTSEAFAKAFRESLQKGIVKHDEKASFVWLPNFIKYNPPESPNVVKAWHTALDLLPECDMRSELIQHVKDFLKGLKKAFREGFAKALPKTMPNQEQEQEQEQKEEEEPAAKTFSLLMADGTNYIVPQSVITATTAAYPLVNIPAELLKMSAWLVSNPGKRKKDAPKFINNWLKGEQRKAEESRAKTALPQTTGRTITETDCGVASWVKSKVAV